MKPTTLVIAAVGAIMLLPGCALRAPNPDCACRVTTTFEGVFTDGHTIEGTYSTSSSELAHIPTGGQWKVTRAKRL
jgi:hypothetical protein